MLFPGKKLVVNRKISQIVAARFGIDMPEMIGKPASLKAGGQKLGIPFGGHGLIVRRS